MGEDKKYQKLKCIFCSYEIASKAKMPKCSQCGSRRLQPIEEFSAMKPFKQKKESATMQYKKKIDQKSEMDPLEDTSSKKKPKIHEEEKDEIEYDELDDELWG